MAGGREMKRFTLCIELCALTICLDVTSCGQEEGAPNNSHKSTNHERIFKASELRQMRCRPTLLNPVTDLGQGQKTIRE